MRNITIKLLFKITDRARATAALGSPSKVRVKCSCRTASTTSTSYPLSFEIACNDKVFVTVVTCYYFSMTKNCCYGDKAVTHDINRVKNETHGEDVTSC